MVALSLMLMTSRVNAAHPHGHFCKSLSANGPMQVTADCIDPVYNTPIYTNHSDDTSPVKHRKVTGYFNGTEIAFNIYMPYQGWEGRFFQMVFPEQLATGNPGEIGYGAESGAYTVHVQGTGGYRADAAVAKLSRTIARKFYNLEPSSKIYGYIYGGSGGSFKTVGAMENTFGVWDGGVPIIQGIPISDPTDASITSLGGLVFGDISEQLKNAVRPGSDIDPKQLMNPVQQAMWEEVTALGMPPAAWEDFDGSGRNRSQVYELLRVAATSLKQTDPTYVNDWWSKSGYLGTEKSELGDLFRSSLIEFNATVRNVERDSDSTPVDIELDRSPSAAPRRNWYEFTLQSECSGEKGGTFTAHMEPNSTKAIIYSDSNSTVLNCLQKDVKLRVDNRWYLALHTFHRHELPSRESYPVFDYLRKADGTPKYPQRSVLAAPIFAQSASGGGTNSGNITGKMIVMDTLMDNKAFPWQADWYRTQVKKSLGDKFNDQYRLYYSDNADHEMGPVESAVKYRLVDFTGLFQQNVRDLAAWVEKGIEPPRQTKYSISNGQVHVPKSASERGGIQPVVHVTVHNATRAEAHVGSPVTLQASVEVPSHAGKIVSLAWDVEGNATFVPVEFGSPAAKMNVNTTHVYTKPGVYIPSIKVASHRSGEKNSTYCLAYNLGRARVIVN